MVRNSSCSQIFKSALSVQMESVNLVSERLVLRDMTEADVPFYYEWYWESNPQTMTCRPIKRKPIEEVIAHMKEHFEKRDVTFLAIRRRDDDTLLGRLTLFDLNESNRCIEIGYMVGPPFRRMGYAREALILTLGHIFGPLELNRVVAQTGSFNDASIALLESLGFQREGRLRQHHVWNGALHDDLLFGLLASEFKDSARNL